MSGPLVVVYHTTELRNSDLAKMRRVGLDRIPGWASPGPALRFPKPPPGLEPGLPPQPRRRALIRNLHHGGNKDWQGDACYCSAACFLCTRLRYHTDRAVTNIVLPVAPEFGSPAPAFAAANPIPFSKSAGLSRLSPNPVTRPRYYWVRESESEKHGLHAVSSPERASLEVRS